MHAWRKPREGYGRSVHTGLSVVAGGALLLYPLLMYFGGARFGMQWMAIGIVAVSMLRIALSRFGPPGADVLGARGLMAICGGVSALALASIWLRSPNAMLYYPLLVNAVMLLVFGSSLIFPPTVVERIARLRHEQLPIEAIPYLRRVTASWCVFFVANGAIALYTAAKSSFETWALYNGLIAYVLIGAMFGGELLLRGRAMRGAAK